MGVRIVDDRVHLNIQGFVFLCDGFAYGLLVETVPFSDPPACSASSVLTLLDSSGMTRTPTPGLRIP